jgi:hypothetical protein
MGSMFLAARCASHFSFNINSSHHYTNFLVAIAFYIEYCPSFIKSVKKRASLIKHCRLKFFSVVNDQIAVPSGRNCPSPYRLPLAISSGWLSNWVGLRTASTSERNMVLAVNAVVRILELMYQRSAVKSPPSSSRRVQKW